MSTSNSKSSLQDVLLRTTDEEAAAAMRARREEDDDTVTIDLRTLHVAPTRHKESIKWQSEPNEGAQIRLEQIPANPYNLSYACLLIPRFSSHYLRGDVAEYLRQWIEQICISFAWHLDFMAVRPEYLQWILSVPPTTPPSRCIRTIREETSRLIFEDFPHYRQQNFSKDFWAPSYLVLVGRAPHPLDMINEFIRLTRQQQGIPPRRSE